MMMNVHPQQHHPHSTEITLHTFPHWMEPTPEERSKKHTHTHTHTIINKSTNTELRTQNHVTPVLKDLKNGFGKS